ncbi:MAG: hypothetical protein GTN74_05635 [Proteobacteria bacterium]|nr:hypothetical protein [Pseudomonadota bacterium]NIS69791.1 hypothetical protein [Pseudomonadota bacterium]
MHRMIVLGVDGLNPDTVKQWLDDLPHLKKMQKEGIWGDLESTLPPAAPQAWISSQCGQNPGAYGLWDYTYRHDFSYAEARLADSNVVDERVDRLHKTLPRRGQKVALIGVPVTWPPPEIPAGYCISDFALTSEKPGFTWPKSLEEEVHNLIGEYLFEARETSFSHGRRDRQRVKKRIYDMDQQRFTLLKHFIHEKKCDYVLAVFGGPKVLWRLFSQEGGRKNDWLHDYYRWMDANLGEMRSGLDDDIALLVYSPYSIGRREGQINLNEWLIHNGDMTLHEYPKKPTAFENLDVDWSKTKCWSMGNSGRVFVNLKGREPQGIVEYGQYDRLLDDLRERLSRIHDENGSPLQIQTFKREEIHSGKYEEYGPDMFVHINRPQWNANELVGYGFGLTCASGQDEGLDGHWNGLYGYFCMSGSKVPARGELKQISVLSIPPTIMEVLGLEIPVDMEKPSILYMAKQEQRKSRASRKERVRSRLKALGY